MHSTILHDVVVKYCFLWLLKKDCNENTLFSLLEIANIECRRKLLKEFYKINLEHRNYQMR